MKLTFAVYEVVAFAVGFSAAGAVLGYAISSISRYWMVVENEGLRAAMDHAQRRQSDLQAKVDATARQRLAALEKARSSRIARKTKTKT